MRRLKGILIVAGIFFSGLLVGAIVGGSAALVDVVNKTFREGPVNVRRLLVQRARHDLKLDDDQAHQFWQVLSETGSELRDALRPVRPQVDAVLARSGERLRSVVKQEQRPKLDRFLRDSDARWRAVMGEPVAGSPAAEPAREP